MAKIKIGISGSLGRMGQEIFKKISKDPRFNFIGGFDKNDKKHSLDAIFKNSKVVIDFSSTTAIKQNLSFAIKHNTGLVVGDVCIPCVVQYSDYCLLAHSVGLREI